MPQKKGTQSMDENVLFKAAREGNIPWLQSLLEENPMLLERVMPLFAETPLHVAASAGKAEFVKNLLSYAPRLAKEPYSRNGLNAMHIAVANGHADVVLVLLDFDPELSVTGDSEGSVSLHYAAYHGRIDITKLLVSRNPTILAHINYKGENALHVAVKRKQSDMITLLGNMLETLGIEFCNQVIRQAKDENGNTVAQLILTSKSQVPAGVFETYTQNSHDEAANNEMKITYDCIQTNVQVPAGVIETYTQNSHDEAPNNETNMDLIAREAMIVIGVLIATVTFQVLMSPPQSLITGGYATSNSSREVIFFLANNSVGFLTSILAILCSLMEDTSMLIFLVIWSLLSTVMNYIVVLKSMMDNKEVFNTLFKYFIIEVLFILFNCLHIFSSKVKNFLRRKKERVRKGIQSIKRALHRKTPAQETTSGL